MSRPPLNVLGSRVRRRRKVLQLSQEAAAHLASVHQTYWSQVETGGRNPSVLTLLRLCRALRVKPGVLLDGLRV